MPIFAGLFAGLFASLASFFAQWVVKKTAFGLAAIATFAVLTVAFIAAMVALINGVLAVGLLPSWFIFGFSYFMPTNFIPLFSATVAAHVAAAVYQWNCENLRVMSYVT